MWCATASWVHLELVYELGRDGAKQNDGGEEVRRRRASAMAGDGARACEREGEKRGSGQGLTASQMSARARSGTAGLLRIDEIERWC